MLAQDWWRRLRDGRRPLVWVASNEAQAKRRLIQVGIPVAWSDENGVQHITCCVGASDTPVTLPVAVVDGGACEEGKWGGEGVTSPHLISSHITSHHITSPHLTSLLPFTSSVFEVEQREGGIEHRLRAAVSAGLERVMKDPDVTPCFCLFPLSDAL
jgi:hypothetical protein